MAARSRRNRGGRQELSGDDKIIEEAKGRFKRVQDWESEFRRLYVADVKFANGDSDNGWQWPDNLRRDREINKRPALTINKTARHVALITNDARQNKPSISIKPTNDDASFESAQIFEGIIRNIEYVSAAQTIYDNATESQVEGGIGYWRINSRFLHERTFDQELLIAPVKDHLSVYLDCDIKQKDGSDALWGFVFDEIPEEEAEKQYPDIDFSNNTGLGETDDWVRNGNVRIAEYYYIEIKQDELIWYKDANGETTFKLSEVLKIKGMKSKLARAEKDPEDGVEIRRRKIEVRQLKWCRIAGGSIVKKLDLPGKYIPIVRVVGIERVIEGRLERKGFVRQMKDPQRMYNYNSSGQVEYGALATKSPWVGPKKAFESNEVQWNRANTSNAAYLTYNDWDAENDRQIAAPVRPEPPGSSPAFLTGMQVATQEMEMVTGQFNPQQNLEKTPKAIDARQRIADTATYQFPDNLAIAIRYTGKILIDWIPFYYDTKRVMQILGKDGTRTNITLQPDAEKAYEEQKKDQDEIDVIFNPSVGTYEVESDIGPAYATQRQEAWNAFLQIVTGAPELINEIGDLMFKSADFPLADKIAERLKRKIANTMPWLLDESPGPVIQKLNEQLQQSSQMVAELMEKVAAQALKLQDYTEKNKISAFDADSKRITALSNAQPELERMGGEGQLEQVIAKILARMAGQPNAEENDLEPGEPDQAVAEAEKADDRPEHVPSQAQKGEDGQWYMEHEPGKFGRVMHPNELTGGENAPA